MSRGGQRGHRGLGAVRRALFWAWACGVRVAAAAEAPADHTAVAADELLAGDTPDVDTGANTAAAARATDGADTVAGVDEATADLAAGSWGHAGEGSVRAALRCGEEGVCTTADANDRLSGACRAGAAEVRFDVRAHARATQPLSLASLRWPDWCGRLVDQHGATLVAVYGDEDCLDHWHPGWRQGAAADAPVPALRTDLLNNPLLLDCLGKLMDDAVGRQTEPTWVVLHALAHATVLASLRG